MEVGHVTKILPVSNNTIGAKMSTGFGSFCLGRSASAERRHLENWTAVRDSEYYIYNPVGGDIVSRKLQKKKKKKRLEQ